MVATKDRWSELGTLLQSLRTQTFQDWDIIVADESSNPISNCGFVSMLLNRIQQEGHKCKVLINSTSNGVCAIRNLLIDNNDWDNELCARLDDDVILEPDYLEQCVLGIEFGFDLVSGVTPHIAIPEWKRQTKFVKPFINDIELDKEGNITKYSDDCGYCYIDSSYITATNFRSNAVYKTKIHKELGIKYETHLSKVGFREEAFFSLRVILAGLKIGVVTSAKAYHYQTPSGGCRVPDYAKCVQQDELSFRKFVKEKFAERGDFISEYKKRVTQ